MSSTEWFRHQCEVRWCISQGLPWFEAYIKGVREHRGRPAAKRLWDDVKAQAAAGNTGATGVWIDVGKVPPKPRQHVTTGAPVAQGELL